MTLSFERLLYTWEGRSLMKSSCFTISMSQYIHGLFFTWFWMKQKHTQPCFLILENNRTITFGDLSFSLPSYTTEGFKNITLYRFGPLCIFLSFQLVILKSWIVMLGCNLATLPRFIYQICSFHSSSCFVHFKTFHCVKIFKHTVHTIFFTTCDFLIICG